MQHHPLNLSLFSPDNCFCAIKPMKICLGEYQGHFSSNMAATRNPLSHKMPRVCENSFHQELWPWFCVGLKFTIPRGWLQRAVQGQGCRWTRTSWATAPPASWALLESLGLGKSNALSGKCAWRPETLLCEGSMHDWDQAWGMLGQLGIHSLAASSVWGIFSVISECCFIIRN